MQRGRIMELPSVQDHVLRWMKERVLYAFNSATPSKTISSLKAPYMGKIILLIILTGVIVPIKAYSFERPTLAGWESKEYYCANNSASLVIVSPKKLLYGEEIVVYLDVCNTGLKRKLLDVAAFRVVLHLVSKAVIQNGLK